MSNTDLFISICFIFGLYGIYIAWQVIIIRLDVEMILKKLKEQNK